MQREVAEYVKKCDQFQRHAPILHQSGGNLNPILSSWPFTQWGFDIIGPFPRALGNKRYVVVAIDYFTKWVEAEALANIKDMDVKKFVWKSIIIRFRVPRVLISDNRLQFDSNVFREYCGSLRITNKYSSPAYPQSNEQAEATNKTIVNGLKKRLEGTKSNWVEELLNVLWAYRITLRRSTGETSFSMTHNAEVVIPIKVTLSSIRVDNFPRSSNNERMVENLDALEEK